MNVRSRIGVLSFLPTLVALALGVQEGRAQEVRARVVDEASRRAVIAAVATLLTTDSVEIARTTTGPDGFFELPAPAPGDYLVRVEYPAFAAELRSVKLGSDQLVIPAFVLGVDVITMDTLQVDVDRAAVTPQGEVGFTRVSHLLSGERMAILEQGGVSIFSAARELGGSIQLKPVKVGERVLTCIESRRRMGGFGGSGRACYNVAIIINGVHTGMDGQDALFFFQTLRIPDWESIQYLPPTEAGMEHGMLAGERGALVLWSRGMGPFKSQERGGG